LVPPQAPKSNGNGPSSTPDDSAYRRYEKGNRENPCRPLNFAAPLFRNVIFLKMWHKYLRPPGSMLGNRANPRT
jgi:hypothetical protein